jgi:hypothetical protein
MVPEDKTLRVNVLKETYVLLEDVSALLYAVELVLTETEATPDHLLLMLRRHLNDALSNMADIISPHPF